jgi:hypothetical protein
MFQSRRQLLQQILQLFQAVQRLFQAFQQVLQFIQQTFQDSKCLLRACAFAQQNCAISPLFRHRQFPAGVARVGWTKGESPYSNILSISIPNRGSPDPD